MTSRFERNAQVIEIEADIPWKTAAQSVVDGQLISKKLADPGCFLIDLGKMVKIGISR